MALFHSFEWLGNILLYIFHIYMYHIIVSIHSAVDGHLGCFHVLAIVNTAAVDIGLRVSFWIRVLSGCMPRDGTARSYGNSNLDFKEPPYCSPKCTVAVPVSFPPRVYFHAFACACPQLGILFCLFDWQTPTKASNFCSNVSSSATFPYFFFLFKLLIMSSLSVFFTQLYILHRHGLFLFI